MHRLLHIITLGITQGITLGMLFSLSAAGIAVAQTLTMPEPAAAQKQTPATPETGYSIKLPGRGMSMVEVESKFGTPQQKIPEVGEPPISRWIYNNFTVYFEHQFVLHAVTHTATDQ